MNTTSSASVTALLALMRIRGVGRRQALKIVNETRARLNKQDCWDSIVSTIEIAPDELAKAWQQSEDQLGKSVSAGIQAFSIYDEGYPKRLRDIPDPPAILFVRGDAGSLHGPKTVAVVGTREPTPYGARVAFKSAQAAAEAGFAVVSGLAHGCDTYGHEGCLESHGVGVAVMAHGLDRVYPAANRKLAEQLVEQGGCLVSEYPIGMAAMRTTFAERDRIQSGLSDGVLVIETDVKGGTMHTVRFSRDQHRPLACIAHPPKWLSEDKTKGNQQLIKEGWASPIPDAEALTAFLGRITHTPPEKPELPPSKAHQTEKQMFWAF